MLADVTDRFAGKADWFDSHYGSTRGRVRLSLVLERLRSILPAPPGRILDAGGGTGAFAVPLAEEGYDVTLLDASAEWIERARANAAGARVSLKSVVAPVEAASAAVQAPFDAILCHAVLMYVDDPAACLRELRLLARDGAILSLLEKNKEGVALRPGLTGDYREASRLLDDSVSAGRLGVENVARSVDEWAALLEQTDWGLFEWAGVRLFSDIASDDLSQDQFDALLDLEREAGHRESYRRVSRLVHLLARTAE
jgi:SAM-dependent methyltransferase